MVKRAWLSFYNTRMLDEFVKVRLSIQFVGVVELLNLDFHLPNVTFSTRHNIYALYVTWFTCARRQQADSSTVADADTVVYVVYSTEFIAPCACELYDIPHN